MIERIASASAFVFSAGATAAGTSVAVSASSPYAWLIPIAIGCFAAMLVRGIDVSKQSKVKKEWMFEALVTALSVLVTGVVVADRHYGPLFATITGVGFGGLGVGLITICKTWVGTMITNLAKTIVSAAPAVPPDPDDKTP